MPITSVTSDAHTLTLTAIGDYPVPLERLWQAWSDPRQLERFWGPPTWPATFTRHDMVAGGRSEYHMTGPNGQVSRGYWDFVRVDAPHSFEVRDGFCHEDGTPNGDFPETHMRFEVVGTASGSRFVAVSTFASAEAMERLVAMGMVEGLTQALSQMDVVLADLRAHSADIRAALSVVDDTHVLIAREVRGSIEQVWRAHHEPDLIRRWMLGPDGWTMPVCEVARVVGENYRYEWESAADGARFGFTGELLASEAPRRAVTTERMLGTEGPSTENELLLVPGPGGRTRIELRITYPSKELRDIVLATGMIDGMETSYARLEEVLAAG